MARPPDYYGATHRRKRARWAVILKQRGFVLCVFCHHPIYHGDEWDMDHKHDGPAHPPCNRGDGGKEGRKNDRLRRIRTRNW